MASVPTSERRRDFRPHPRADLLLRTAGSSDSAASFCREAVAAAVIAYLIETIGPALNWPEPVLAVSPFHHLANVPAEPFDLIAAVNVIAVAALLTMAGHWHFEHRDLTGD